ncbi:MAG: hypothetical protein K2M75_02625 [Clostridia bacterium]|nr:hypothetical protein [Clostridia bacterium]
MKKDSKTRNKDIELYEYLDYEYSVDDYRYWGLFFNKKGRLMVDPKRFQKMIGRNFSQDILKVINNRNTHYFYPKTLNYVKCNIGYFYDTIYEINDEWKKIYLPLIEREVERIKKEEPLTIADDYNFMCGISSSIAAQARANFINAMRNADYNRNREYLLKSLYAQFFHQMMSKTEAVSVRVLTKNKAMKDRFDRTVLYATAYNCNKSIEQLENYADYDKAYCIWNFIKHNSQSTYLTLKSRYQEVLIDTQYSQGEMAFLYIKFDNDLIQNLIDGLRKFFEEYCELVHSDENYRESQWNYDDYFISIADYEINKINNPLGLDVFDDID